MLMIYGKRHQARHSRLIDPTKSIFTDAPAKTVLFLHRVGRDEEYALVDGSREGVCVRAPPDAEEERIHANDARLLRRPCTAVVVVTWRWGTKTAMSWTTMI
jgi:hypothetical protein